jgi:hypothetical protein
MLENKSPAAVASSEKRNAGFVKIRKSKEKRSSLKYSPWSTSPFHCSFEWHLQDMGSRLAAPLYSWGGRLSRKSESFFPSVESIAIHFGRDRTTVFRALQELAREGWAEIVQREPGKPVTYRFITHKEWSRNHPDCCPKKDVMPWDGQGDPLGKQLYAASGGLAKFFPGQMTGLRKYDLPDDQIAMEFRAFLDQNPQKGADWKRVYYPFRVHLSRIARAIRSAAGDAAKTKTSCNGGMRQSHPRGMRGSDPGGCVGATPGGCARATQVVEVEFTDGVGTSRVKSSIPTPASQERSIASPTKDVFHGRGFPPSKPSPGEKTNPESNPSFVRPPTRSIDEQKADLRERGYLR